MYSQIHGTHINIMISKIDVRENKQYIKINCGGLYPKNWMDPWKWGETESVMGLSLLLCPLLSSKRTQ